MKRRLYTMTDGVPILCDDVDYWREKFNLSIPPEVHFNPFVHLIKGDYSFYHEDVLMVVKIDIKGGIGRWMTYDNNKNLIIGFEMDNLYDFHVAQIKFWNIFGVPLVHHLLCIERITKEDINDYCSVLFFPPVMDRTEWDYTEK